MARLIWKVLSIMLCLTFIAMVVPLMVACTSSTTSTPTTTTPTATTQTPTKVLKIGYTANLQSKEGLQVQKWMNLFAKQYNDRGGWKIGNDTYSVQMIGYDDGYDPIKATAAVQRLVYQDKVKYIISMFGSSVVDAALKITEPEKVLLFGITISPTTSKPDYKYVFKTAATFFAKGHHSTAYKDFKDKGATSVVNICPDTEGGRTVAAQCSKIEESVGLKVLDNMFYALGTIDFMAIATKANNLKPDLVSILTKTAANEYIEITYSLLQIGYKGYIFSDSVNFGDIPLLIQKLGSDTVDKLGLVCAFSDPRTFLKGDMLALCDAYEKEYGKWETEGTTYVNGWFIFQDAVNYTQSTDTEVLANYLGSNPRPVECFFTWLQLFARPDLQNYRTIEVAGETKLSVVKGGILVPWKVVTVKENYLSTITALGLHDVYQEYWDKYGYPKFAGE